MIFHDFFFFWTAPYSRDCPGLWEIILRCAVCAARARWQDSSQVSHLHIHPPIPAPILLHMLLPIYPPIIILVPCMSLPAQWIACTTAWVMSRASTHRFEYPTAHQAKGGKHKARGNGMWRQAQYELRRDCSCVFPLLNLSLSNPLIWSGLSQYTSHPRPSCIYVFPLLNPPFSNYLLWSALSQYTRGERAMEGSDTYACMD